MNRVLALVAALLLLFPSAAAEAGKARYSNATMCAVLDPCVPPSAFASGPFLQPVKIVSVSLREIQSFCGHKPTYAAKIGKDTHADRAAIGDYGIMGCAELTGAACVVHMPGELKNKVPELYTLVLAHELGHCRGWVHGG